VKTKSPPKERKLNVSPKHGFKNNISKGKASLGMTQI
jgi:hypothetical protein